MPSLTPQTWGLVPETRFSRKTFQQRQKSPSQVGRGLLGRADRWPLMWIPRICESNFRGPLQAGGPSLHCLLIATDSVTVPVEVSTVPGRALVDGSSPCGSGGGAVREGCNGRRRGNGRRYRSSRYLPGSQVRGRFVRRCLLGSDLAGGSLFGSSVGGSLVGYDLVCSSLVGNHLVCSGLVGGRPEGNDPLGFCFGKPDQTLVASHSANEEVVIVFSILTGRETGRVGRIRGSWRCDRRLLGGCGQGRFGGR